MTLTLVFVVILVALLFTYTNGFHDTANSIATVVGTKVLTPRQAILLATATTLVGSMAIAAAHGDLSAVVWARAPAVGKHWWDGGGIFFKVVFPMVVSPLSCLILPS